METDEVVKNLPSDTTPCPDGFNGAFIKACWNTDLYKLIEDFYFGRINLQSGNASFITLIPKKKLSFDCQ